MKKLSIYLALFFLLLASMASAATYRGHIEPEVLVYDALAGASTDWFTSNGRVLLIKRSTGIVLASATLKMSLVNPRLVTNSSQDLRLYALIFGVQFSISDGTKAAVFSGTITKGTGETAGTNPFASLNFKDGVWTALANMTLTDADTLTSTAAQVSAYYPGIFTLGKLYKTSATASTTATEITLRCLQVGVASSEMNALYNGTAQYYTITDANKSAFAVRSESAGVSDFTVLSVQNITTADATGFNATVCTDAGIVPNSASFTVTVTRP